MYQSLDHELQRHVSLQDTLEQCKVWLGTVTEEPEPPTNPSLSLEEALHQVIRPYLLLQEEFQRVSLHDFIFCFFVFFTWGPNCVLIKCNCLSEKHQMSVNK